MTSNIGSEWTQNFSMGEEERRIRILDALRNAFRPEFLNRIDDIIIFRSLTMSDIDRIIHIQIAQIQKRLEEKKITIDLTEQAKQYISRIGYSPTYGARPLRRTLQKIVQDSLAIKLLEGAFTEGDHIVLDINDKGEAVFEKIDRAV
jgi:ATP-dependent Clp protease ATP-binding subunit ClpB